MGIAIRAHLLGIPVPDLSFIMRAIKLFVRIKGLDFAREDGFVLDYKADLFLRNEIIYFCIIKWEIYLIVRCSP